MSGTSYGACILHVAPEAFVGGPFACVETGDVIELDVAERRLHLDVPDDVLAARRGERPANAPRAMALDHAPEKIHIAAAGAELACDGEARVGAVIPARGR